MRSEVGHLALLPAGSSTSTPKAADLSPKDWDSRALLCLVPSHLLEEQEAGRGGWVAQPPGGAQGRHLACPPPRSEVCGEGAEALHPKSLTAISLAPPALPCLTCLGNDIYSSRSQGKMQEKQAVGRAGLGNLKQH